MAIEIKGLIKHYSSVQALRGIDLTFEDSKIYGLLGRNGAGKTTLLNILTGRQFATAGTATLNGAPLAENDAALRHIYMLSEATYYPESMKVRDVFKWSAEFYPDFDKAYADDLTGRFGLNVNSKVSGLSTGYNTIFKLIVALACGAPYLLLDEPVLGLDANHRDLFYKAVIERYSKSPCCIVLSTHLVEEVSPLVEEVVIIHQGSILKHETRDDLLAGGYTVTGSAAKVDAYTQGKTVIGTDAIGGLKTAYLLGARTEVPEGLEVTGMDLQRLFVQLTNV
ncbi:ABC transporter ATP-binding protein [Ruminococcaceae bacterium OttesenSCG-928-A11]|nr:ABC transporter ATP-binding protein [Ruminococcaceae bacterium OttesenSCG-928-A11]